MPIKQIHAQSHLWFTIITIITIIVVAVNILIGSSITTTLSTTSFELTLNQSYSTPNIAMDSYITTTLTGNPSSQYQSSKITPDAVELPKDDYFLQYLPNSLLMTIQSVNLQYIYGLFVYLLGCLIYYNSKQYALPYLKLDSTISMIWFSILSLSLSANKLLVSGGYIFVNSKLNWGSAQSHCETNYGTSLATINTQTENDLINNFVVGASNTHVWIGFTDQDLYSTEDTFVWVDGSSINGNDYTNWDGNSEPNDYNDNEDCTFMRRDTGKWNDSDCQNTIKFVCNYGYGEWILSSDQMPYYYSVPEINWNDNQFPLPFTHSPRMTGTIIYNGKIYGFGGDSTDNVGNYVYWTDLNNLDSDEVSVWSDYEWKTDDTTGVEYTYDGSKFFTTSSTNVGNLAFFKRNNGGNANEHLHSFDMDENKQLYFSEYTFEFPTSVSQPCLTNNNTHLFVIGGNTLLQIYDVENNIWSYGSSMQNNHNWGSCSFDQLSNYIFIEGGSDNNIIEYYNIEQDTWTTLDSTLEYKRAQQLSVLFQYDLDSPSYIFVMGGHVAKTNLDYTEIVEINYDKNGNVDNINSKVLDYITYGEPNNFPSNIRLGDPKWLPGDEYNMVDITYENIDNSGLRIEHIDFSKTFVFIGGDGFGNVLTKGVVSWNINRIVGPTDPPTPIPTSPTLEPSPRPTTLPTSPTVSPTLFPTYTFENGCEDSRDMTPYGVGASYNDIYDIDVINGCPHSITIDGTQIDVDTLPLFLWFTLDLVDGNDEAYNPQYSSEYFMIESTLSIFDENLEFGPLYESGIIFRTRFGISDSFFPGEETLDTYWFSIKVNNIVRFSWYYYYDYADYENSNTIIQGHISDLTSGIIESIDYDTHYTLRVLAMDNKYTFWINNIMIWENIEDNTYDSTGSVGLSCFSGVTYHSFYYIPFHPTNAPTSPTFQPTPLPTSPTSEPTPKPTLKPTSLPTSPTVEPTVFPTYTFENECEDFSIMDLDGDGTTHYSINYGDDVTDGCPTSLRISTDYENANYEVFAWFGESLGGYYKDYNPNYSSKYFVMESTLSIFHEESVHGVSYDQGIIFRATTYNSPPTFLLKSYRFTINPNNKVKFSTYTYNLFYDESIVSTMIEGDISELTLNMIESIDYDTHYTLRVKGIDNKYTFWINDIMIWENIEDNTFDSTGSVGISCFSGVTYHSFFYNPISEREFVLPIREPTTYPTYQFQCTPFSSMTIYKGEFVINDDNGKDGCTETINANNQIVNTVWMGDIDSLTYNNDYSDNNFMVETILSISEGQWDAGLIFRATSLSSSFYYFSILPRENWVVIWKCCDWEHIKSITPINGIDYGIEYKLRIEGNGNSYTFYIDDDIILENYILDDLEPIGSVGIMSEDVDVTFYSFYYQSLSDVDE